MHIEVATKKYSDDIIDMAAEFYAQTEMSQRVELDWLSLVKLVDYIFDNGVFLVAMSHNTVIGMLAGIVFPNIFNQEKLVAQEMAWYMRPEYRANPGGLKLLKAFEQWATEKNAAVIVMAALPNTHIGTIYERKGYVGSDVYFIKGL